MSPREERQFRFQKIFLNKIREESKLDGSARSFPGVDHKLGTSISSYDIGTIRSAKKANIELPLIIFLCDEGKILISTSGIFFEPISGDKAQFEWSELSFTVAPNTIYDDFTFRLETDEKLLKEEARNKSKKWSFWGSLAATVAVLALATNQMESLILTHGTFVQIILYVIFAIWLLIAMPFFWAIFYQLVNKILVKRFVRRWAGFSNILYIRPHNCRINIGAKPYTEDIISCIMLALEIYRAQLMKYGQ